MLSKKTVVEAAIIILREAMENNRFQKDGNQILQRIREGNIYGMFSDSTANGTTSEELHEWYDREVFELQAGLDFSRTGDQFVSSWEFMKGNEFIQLNNWGEIDAYIKREPLNDMDLNDYTEKMGRTKWDETLRTPYGTLVNGLVQVIDWDELWADNDFTTDTLDVVFLREDELVTNRNEYARVLDINAALSYYDLPLMDEFLEDHTDLNRDPDWSEVFKKFVGDYLIKAPMQEQLIRTIGYNFIY